MAGSEPTAAAGLARRLAGVCILIGMAGFAWSRFTRDPPLLASYVTLVFCALAVVLIIASAFLRARR